jgi:hypothetical protein
MKQQSFYWLAAAAATALLHLMVDALAATLEIRIWRVLNMNVNHVWLILICCQANMLISFRANMVFTRKLNLN